MTALRRYEDLRDHLVAEGVPHRADDAARQLVLPVVEGTFQGSAWLMWPDRVTLVQVLVPLAFTVSPSVLRPVAEAMVRLNDQLLVPGFGVDADHDQPYFRLFQPYDASVGLSPPSVQRMVQTAVRTAATYGPFLALVAEGELEPGDVVAVAEGA